MVFNGLTFSNEAIAGLIHAIIALPHKSQQHRRVKQIHDVLYCNIGIAKNGSCAALTSHISSS